MTCKVYLDVDHVDAHDVDFDVDWVDVDDVDDVDPFKPPLC